VSKFTHSMFKNSVEALTSEPTMDLDVARATAATLGADTPEEIPAKLDVNRLTRAFVHMRDARLKLKSHFEKQDRAIKAKQAVIEAAMLDFLNTHNLDSAPTEAGTFYRQKETTPTGSDWDAFYKWVKEQDAFDFLERRIKKTAINDYMEEHDGAIPPGVSVFTEFVVRVRRK